MPRSSTITKRVERALARYQKLPVKLGFRCWLIEASKLIRLAQSDEFGYHDSEIIEFLLRKLTRNNVNICCRCRDNNCNWWYGNNCMCLSQHSLECDNLAVCAIDSHGHVIIRRVLH